MPIKQKLFWPSTFLLLLLFQATLSSWIAIAGVFPNFLLLAIVFFALRHGPLVGVWLGFFLGLAADALGISLFGSQTFVYTLMGFLMGRLKGKIDSAKPLAQVSIIFLASLFFLGGIIFLELLFGGSGQRFEVRTSIFNPLYSAAVAPIVFFLLERWQGLFHPLKSSL